MLNRAKPKKICMKIETVFFFLRRPDSKSPSAGIIKSTKLPATSIHAVSPESIGTIGVFSNALIRLTLFSIVVISIEIQKNLF